MLVVIVGATGTGKSTLSLELAERLAASGRPAEIVNADAMQLYRGMDIGTAKLAVGERRGVPHHLLDVLDPTDEASVAGYQAEARAAIEDILGRNATPILVGGSGLYVSSVVYDFRFPGTDPVIRERLEAQLDAEGPGMMFRRLREVDPRAAEAIGPHNGRRIVRALEVVELTGGPFGSGLPDESSLWTPQTTTVGLTTPREQLVPRLDARVSRMWADGLVEEAASLDRAGLGVTAARAIGYAQAIAQLRGALTEEQAIDETRVLTRKYARRQVGWFKRYPGTNWLGSDDPDRVDAAWQLLLNNG
ncbi:MAG: tRNA dimethylallyltransferase [Microbacteriaceae bacterium]|nr:tRNA dimethylallyltransferase [Microbacteriaceae bacterium]